MHRVLRLGPRGARLLVGGAGVVGALEYQKATCKDGPQPFSLTVPKFDESTFQGRFYKMLEVIDPRMLVYSEKDLDEAKKKLADFKAGTSTATDEELWEAKKAVDVMVHTATGETMFWLGRMSAFVPVNVPIIIGMLSATSPAQQLFWQWVNQTYNVVNNYVNRSSDALEWGQIGQAYGLAVLSAGTIAVGAGKVVESSPALQKFGVLVPYFAVVSAGAANVGFTRIDEMRKGVKVSDADGNVVGVSCAAGKQAVLQTVLTRNCCLPILPLLVPPLTMKALGITSKMGKMAGEVVLVTLAFSLGLPAALAIMPQQMEVAVTSLEPEFHNLTDKSGQPITKLYANKGL